MRWRFAWELAQVIALFPLAVIWLATVLTLFGINWITSKLLTLLDGNFEGGFYGPRF